MRSDTARRVSVVILPLLLPCALAGWGDARRLALADQLYLGE